MDTGTPVPDRHSGSIERMIQLLTRKLWSYRVAETSPVKGHTRGGNGRHKFQQLFCFCVHILKDIECTLRIYLHVTSVDKKG